MGGGEGGHEADFSARNTVERRITSSKGPETGAGLADQKKSRLASDAGAEWGVEEEGQEGRTPALWRGGLGGPEATGDDLGSCSDRQGALF